MIYLAGWTLVAPFLLVALGRSAYRAYRLGASGEQIQRAWADKVERAHVATVGLSALVVSLVPGSGAFIARVLAALDAKQDELDRRAPRG